MVADEGWYLIIMILAGILVAALGWALLRRYRGIAVLFGWEFWVRESGVSPLVLAAPSDVWTAFIENFPVLMQVLQSLPDGLPNIHIGVVSSTMGAGQFADIPQCPPGGGANASELSSTVRFSTVSNATLHFPSVNTSARRTYSSS